MSFQSFVSPRFWTWGFVPMCKIRFLSFAKSTAIMGDIYGLGVDSVNAANEMRAERRNYQGSLQKWSNSGLSVAGRLVVGQGRSCGFWRALGMGPAGAGAFPMSGSPAPLCRGSAARSQRDTRSSPRAVLSAIVRPIFGRGSRVKCLQYGLRFAVHNSQ